MPELKMLQVEQETKDLVVEMVKIHSKKSIDNGGKKVSIKAYIHSLVEKDQRDEHEKESMGNIQSDANR